MNFKCINIFIYSLLFLLSPFFMYAQSTDTTVMHIKKTRDFQITGDGNAANWRGVEWTTLPQRNNKSAYQTQIKLLYSDTGVYCLYRCEDKKITATLKGDFLDLWHEDVVEAFFWPDQTMPLYFEYELSPLNYELPILVPNKKGTFFGWLPWHYEGDRKTRHATFINKQGDIATSWIAEFFIPFTLLKALDNVPPEKGTKWRANFYRIDHDNGEAYWSWQLTRTNFHDYERFGTIVFD